MGLHPAEGFLGTYFIIGAAAAVVGEALESGQALAVDLAEVSAQADEIVTVLVRRTTPATVVHAAFVGLEVAVRGRHAIFVLVTARQTLASRVVAPLANRATQWRAAGIQTMVVKADCIRRAIDVVDAFRDTNSVDAPWIIRIPAVRIH
jgi:hypothetical protein